MLFTENILQNKNDIFIINDINRLININASIIIIFSLFFIEIVIHCFNLIAINLNLALNLVKTEWRVRLLHKYSKATRFGSKKEPT